MKGSPGGILLIGVGIVLLSLGWTGRFAAVWDAITGGTGSGSGSGSGSDTGSGSGSGSTPNVAQCSGRDQAVSTDSGTQCYSPSAMASPENGKCRSGYTPGTRTADNAMVCVLNDAGSAPGSGSGSGNQARCVDRRTIPANQVGIHVSDWKDCCTKEILMYNPNASPASEPYLCITRDSDVSKAKAQGYAISFQGTAGEASLVMGPLGFLTTRYVPNGKLYA